MQDEEDKGMRPLISSIRGLLFFADLHTSATVNSRVRGVRTMASFAPPASARRWSTSSYLEGKWSQIENLEITYQSTSQLT